MPPSGLLYLFSSFFDQVRLLGWLCFYSLFVHHSFSGCKDTMTVFTPPNLFASFFTFFLKVDFSTLLPFKPSLFLPLVIPLSPKRPQRYYHTFFYSKLLLKFFRFFCLILFDDHFAIFCLVIGPVWEM